MPFYTASSGSIARCEAAPLFDSESVRKSIHQSESWNSSIFRRDSHSDSRRHPSRIGCSQSVIARPNETARSGQPNFKSPSKKNRSPGSLAKNARDRVMTVGVGYK
jgi:hypothetical protein